MSAEEMIDEARRNQIEIRWKSDVDFKLDELVSAEKGRKKYDAFLDMLIAREAERADLRRAIIKHALSGLAMMAVVGLLSLAWSGLRADWGAVVNAVKGGK